jgi:hypothetical protein
VNADAARAALGQLAETWGTRYGAIIRLWENAWQEFIPFLDYDVEIRKVLCSTNAIESLNARYRRAVKARGHFPTEQAALKCLYLVTRSLDPTGTGRTRVGDQMETRLERIRHHLRRPVPGRRDLLTMTAGNTVREIDPLKTLMSAFRQRLRGAVVASALGDVQVAGVFEGRDDGSPDGGQVGRPVAGPAGRTSSREVTSRTWWCASMGQCSRTSRARSCAVASALVRLVMA